MTETHTPLPELLRELSKVIVDHLGGGSEWFTRVGDDFYVDPKAIGPELRRRKTDAQITKKALFRANTRAGSHHRLVEALEAARTIIADIDDYMKRPSRGDWGEECACCMGELLDDDRQAIAKIDAILTKAEAGQ